jgi:5-methylthioribose kinase
MAYKQLTEELVLDYVKNLDEMKNKFSSFDNVSIKEVGDGNLNYVYIVTNDSNPEQTIILKQAVPFLRVVGESWPLDIERMEFEVMALRQQYEYCPDLVPEIYYADNEMSLVIMQNLNKHIIMRGEMNLGKKFPKMPDHISTFLAVMLFKSSDWGMAGKTDKWPHHDTASKKIMVEKYINKDLCNLTENFIFSYPLYKSDTNAYTQGLTEEDLADIQEDNELKVKIALIRYKFMNNAEALLHGDLHTGSIMVNDDETYIIDPEFAFYGPAGFDIGLLIGNMFLAYIAQVYRQVQLGNIPYDYRKWVLDAIEEIWEGFALKYDKLWQEKEEKDRYPMWDYPDGKEAFNMLRKTEILRIFKDAIGIAGSVMIRRTLGLAKVSDIADIEDNKARSALDRLALKTGKQFVLRADSLSSIQEVITIAKEISPLE